jgi:hypothetical protein
VTGVEVNIQDSDAGNDDAVTSANNGNGLTNGVAKFVAIAAVTPNPAISVTHSNFPLEFRLNYVNVPLSGAATITVRLREATTSLFTNRITVLTRTLNTFAPPSVIFVNTPGVEGQILSLNSNATYLTHTCLSAGLTNDVNLFSIFINGMLQARSNYIFVGSGCGAGLRSLYYYWNAPTAGTNVIVVGYSNLSTIISGTRTVAVAYPGDSDGDGISDYSEIISGTDPLDSNSVLRITELANGNQLVVWDSVAGRNYEVQGTTNLNVPLETLSPPIQASGSSSFFFDTSTNASSKFYRIKLLP